MIDINGFKSETKHESGLLKFMDYIEISLRGSGGAPIADGRYVLHLSDGLKKEGCLYSRRKSSEEGTLRGTAGLDSPTESR